MVAEQGCGAALWPHRSHSPLVAAGGLVRRVRLTQLHERVVPLGYPLHGRSKTCRRSVS